MHHTAQNPNTNKAQAMQSTHQSHRITPHSPISPTTPKLIKREKMKRRVVYWAVVLALVVCSCGLADSSSVFGYISLSSDWATQHPSASLQVSVFVLNTTDSGNADPLHDEAVYYTPPFAKYSTVKVSQCTYASGDSASVQCYYTIDLPDSAANYSVVAFADELADGVMHTEKLVPVGWCATEPSGPYKILTVGSKKVDFECNIPLYSISAWPSETTRHGNGVLYWQSGFHVLHTWGTAEERGEAYGFLLARYIVEFFQFYFLERNVDGVSNYNNIVLPYLESYMQVPQVMQEIMDGIISGMSASGEDISVVSLNRNFSTIDILAINAYLEASEVVSDPCDSLAEHPPRKITPACTQATLWGPRTTSGEIIHGRNMDGELDIRRVTINHLLIHATEPSSGYRTVSVMWPGYVGTLSGVSESGISIMENAARFSANYTCIKGWPAAWMIQDALETFNPSITSTEALEWMESNYMDAAGGISPGGSILVIATPYSGTEHAPSYVLEADRYGQVMRTPGQVSPWDTNAITASNHFLVYGANQQLNKNFGQSASFSSLWRYEASKNLISAWSRTGQQADVASMARLLQTVAEGETEHSIIWEPSTRQLSIGIAAMEPVMWDAPFTDWTTFDFDSFFTQQ
ncbi:hypothetical protein Pelo_12700 [Pelomyxa schiedti]|nr:hypothetical protein Pelo_12700 [Pelomyxa schiedti]